MTTTTAHPNVDTVNAIVPAMRAQDHAALTKIFTDDLVLHLRGPVPVAGDHQGVGGLAEAIGGLLSLAEVELEQVFCVGTDGWASEFEIATLRRNGKTLTCHDTFVYRFEGERIAEMWFLIDTDPDKAAAFLA